MKKFFEFINQYITSLNWQFFSIFKLCLISLGVLIGVFLPTDVKTTIGVVAGVLFAVTFFPITVPFIKAWFNFYK